MAGRSKKKGGFDLPDWLMVILIAVALSADAFSLALGMGMSNLANRSILRFAGSVGLFHVIMPLAGIIVGNFLGGLVGKVAVWLGGGILIILGLRMVWDGLPREKVFNFRNARQLLGTAPSTPSLHWGGVLVLSWSVSVDAFGVGVGLGAAMYGKYYTILVIGAVAGLITAAGMVLGRYLGRLVGNWAEVGGGLVLVGIGAKLLSGF